MKKLLALVLVLTLVLGMGVGAFAEDDWAEVPINKNLTSQGLNPAETFHFIVGEGSGERDGKDIIAPDFDEYTEFSITIDEGGSFNSYDLVLPEFTQVGVYTYSISEVEGNTAGMVYDDGLKELVITVINNLDYDPEDPDSPKFLRVVTITDYDDNQEPIKVDAFENEFYSGDLTVTKVIEGNFADPDDEFEIIVTLTPVEGKVLNSDAIEHDGGTISVLNETTGEIKIAYSGIKGGDSFTIQNIPYDVNYLVEEVTNEEGFANGYTVAYDELRAGLMNDEAIFTTITNTRITEVPTGVNLDNLPYVLILGAASVGLVAFTLKRRFSDDR